MRHPQLLRTVTLALAVILLVARAGQAAAQSDLEDVVYLKDGSIVRGILVEQVPGQSLLIRTRDGSQFRYPMDQVARITREPPQATAPAAAPPQIRQGNPKSGGTAVLYSLLLTGGGQFYNGDAGLGLGLLLTGLISAPFFVDATVTCYDSGEQCGVSLGLGVIFFGSKIFSIIEAPMGTRRWNREHGYALDLTPRPDVRVARTPYGPADVRVGVSLARLAF
ncbi:MAG TPA: hypothetical protein VFH97_09175 [Gemmatimonadales bacterium]|nr:hypothetical protein [Gemmatimonadales bacterium]